MECKLKLCRCFELLPLAASGHVTGWEKCGQETAQSLSWVHAFYFLHFENSQLNKGSNRGLHTPIAAVLVTFISPTVNLCNLWSENSCLKGTEPYMLSERVGRFYHLATLPTPISGAHFSWCRPPDVANCSGLVRTAVAIYIPSRQSTWDLFTANKFCHYTLLRCVPGLLASRPPSSVLSLSRYSLPCCAVYVQTETRHVSGCLNFWKRRRKVFFYFATFGTTNDFLLTTELCEARAKLASLLLTPFHALHWLHPTIMFCYAVGLVHAC